MSKVEMTGMQAFPDGVQFTASTDGAQGLFLVPIDILSDLAGSSMDFDDEMIESFTSHANLIAKAVAITVAENGMPAPGERVELPRSGFPNLD